MSTEATVIVHWPGKDTPACDFHAAQLVEVGARMGFRVSTTPCVWPQYCANCERVAATRQGNPVQGR